MGSNAVIDLGRGNSVTLVGVLSASLAASDFVNFVPPDSQDTELGALQAGSDL